MASRNIRSSDTNIIVMASDLCSGMAVYHDQQGGWSESANEARVFTDKQSAEAVVAAEQHAGSPVVDAYLAASDVNGEPSHVRELIRRYGPTIAPAGSHDTPVYDFVGLG